MNIDETAFEAAAQLVHSNYSERPWNGREAYADRIFARGTLKGALEKLGIQDTFDDAERARAEAVEARNEAQLLATGFRAASLTLSEALTRAWEAAGGDPRTGFGTEPDVVAVKVRAAIEIAKGPWVPVVEVTDDMLNTVALGMFGHSVVYDRERLRAALAEALQTR